MSEHNRAWNTSVFMRVFLTSEQILVGFADMLPFLGNISIVDTCSCSDELYSWKVEDSLFVTLFKHSDLQTYVYVHSLNKLFGVTEYLYLDENCPVGSVFVGQMSIDNFDHMTQKYQYDDIRINLLVFDIIQLGTTCYQNVRPLDRYNLLRECAPSCFSPDRNVILQW
jgi:c-di-AMP phosphodiesterase-like protein